MTVNDTGEALAVHVHCSGLLGDRAPCQYDSFSEKMVRKRPFISDTGRSLGSTHSFFRTPGRQCFEPFSRETELEVDMIF